MCVHVYACMRVCVYMCMRVGVYACMCVCVCSSSFAEGRDRIIHKCFALFGLLVLSFSFQLSLLCSFSFLKKGRCSVVLYVCVPIVHACSLICTLLFIDLDYTLRYPFDDSSHI